MKVATFNANSVRQRLPIITEWLAENEPDVLAIQETKVDDPLFPAGDFEDVGYNVVFHGQKGTNGVATASREMALRTTVGFEDPMFPVDARILTTAIGPLTVINTYVPNGTAVGSDKFEYKLRWLARFKQFVNERFRPDEAVVWMGDINIAPTSIDVYNSRRFYGGVGHHPLEFKALDEIKAWGWVDVFRKFNPGPGLYTYWDYYITTAFKNNLGWRIDHIYASPALAEKCVACDVDKGPRGLEKPSDHTPVWAEFDL